MKAGLDGDGGEENGANGIFMDSKAPTSFPFFRAL
jgi:hypothetical protein